MAGIAVEPGDFEPRTAIDDVRIQRIGSHVGILISADRMPVIRRDLAIIATAEHSSGAALLLAAINPVRMLVVGDDMIELRGRLVIPGTPGASTVDSDRGALIYAEKDDVGILGIDPDRVIVVSAGRALPGDEVLTTVGRFVA